METVYLSLGSNIGDRKKYLEQSINHLNEVGEVIEVSSVYQTPPWGVDSQQDYYNMCIAFKTLLSPELLLAEIHRIEHALGRERGEQRWLPRTVDIDIIFYGQRIIDTEDLKVPHPLMQQRKFVLLPLSEIASDMEHPVLHKKIIALLKEVEDDSEIFLL